MRQHNGGGADVRPQQPIFWSGLALVCGLSSMVYLSGCAGSTTQTRLASAKTCPMGPMGESMCKHCNCLMPAGLDSGTLCPVCHCKRRAFECVRR